MRDFLNYGSSIDIRVFILTLAFIIIWKFFIEKKIKRWKSQLDILVQ